MKKLINRNFLWIAFGVGCIIALVLPTVWTTRILAIAVTVLGVICCTRSKDEKC